MLRLLLRIVILLLAAGLPLGAITLKWGPPPYTLDPVKLNEWAPLKQAGPSAETLAGGVTWLAGAGHQTPPDWFTEEDQKVLAQAEGALRANRLQAGLGHLMVLSSHLEERGKTLNDFLPIVVPDLAAWLVANYFAPILLGLLAASLVVLFLLPWLARRLLDVVKIVLTVAAGTAALGGAVMAGIAIAGQRALVFTLIEYLVVVAGLMLVLNSIAFLRLRRRKRSRRADPVLAVTAPATPATPELAAPAAPPPLTTAGGDLLRVRVRIAPVLKPEEGSAG